MIKDNKDILKAATKILSALLLGYALALRNVTMDKKSGVNQQGGLGSKDISNASISTVTNLARDLLDSVVPIIDKTFTSTVTGRYARMNPEDASKNLNDFLTRQTELLVRISNDEVLMKKLEEWAMYSTQIGIDAISTTLPAIDDITDEFWIAANSVITKSIIASINTAFNITEAAISEVPIIGGAIVLFFSFIRGVNEGLLAGAHAVKSGTKNTILSAKTGQKVAAGVKENIEKANRAAQELKDALNVSLNTNAVSAIRNTGRDFGKKSMEQISNNKNSVGGGRKSKRHLSKKLLKKHIRLSSKRLEKRFRKFSIKKQTRKHKKRPTRK